MKIGILTAHAQYSYERSLHAYALQEFLRSNKHDTEIVNYCPRAFTSWNRGLLKEEKQRIENFEAFQSQFLQCSEAIHNKIEALQLEGRYDWLIAGGVGVFDCKVTKGLKSVFYGSFDKNAKKAAFSISIRRNTAPTYEEEFNRKNLAGYRAINACDEIIAERLQPYTDLTVGVTRNLLLLLDKEDYLKPAEKLVPSKNGKKDRDFRKKQRSKSPYILLHTIDGEWTVRKVAEKLAEFTGLPVIHNCTNVNFMGQPGTVANCGPEQIPLYVNEAEYVVTNVSDTAVLAAMFEKKMIVVTPGVDEQRICAFATAAGLDGQMISAHADFVATEQAEVNYAEVSPRINAMKQSLRESILKTLEMD